MIFKLLGPVEVWAYGKRLPVGSSMQQRLLAVLMLQANRVVGCDRLIDLLWNTRPPTTARAGLHGRVSHLRRVLAPIGQDRLLFRPPGYLLQVAPGELDVAEFGRLVDEGRQLLAAGAAVRASQALHAALALWGGPALHGVDGLGAEAARLEESRLAALEDRMEADLGLGRHRQLVAELKGLTAAQPLRERPHAQLMLALYRAGRHADTLAVFRKFRDRMVDELGLEPGPSLQELHLQILTGDPTLAAPTSPTIGVQINAARTSVSTPPPSQLPPAVNDLTGREKEVAGLQEQLLGAETNGGPVVCTVYGPAGGGKTALAVRVGTRFGRPFLPVSCM